MPSILQGVISDDVKVSYLDWLAGDDADRQERYRAYREYFDGQHDTQLTDRQARYLQVKMGEEFNANYCPIVVNALAERLTLTGFQAESQADLFWDWWTQNRMDGVQGILHTATVRDGDAYLIVEWDAANDRPRFTYELAYDGTEGVKVHYSGERRHKVVFASKRWRIDQGADAGYKRRLNLYYANRIEKYASDQREYEGNWREYQEEADPSWPLWWTRDGTEGGEPLGVPVVHFKNADEGYNYGQSELRDVIPLQNALNKSIIDILASADSTGFRIFYMLGDNPGALSVVPGSWVYSEKPANQVSLGVFDGANFEPLLRLKDNFVVAIAQISRTPLSYFQTSGQRPAEGTLKQEESGLVAKVRNRHVSFGNAWEDAFMMARRLHNTYSAGPALDEEQPIEAVWADPETRNEKEFYETLALKKEKLGIPLATIWAEAGYTPAEIEQMQQSDEHQARINVLRLGFGNQAGTEDDGPSRADDEESDEGDERA